MSVTFFLHTCEAASPIPLKTSCRNSLEGQPDFDRIRSVFRKRERERDPFQRHHIVSARPIANVVLPHSVDVHCHVYSTENRRTNLNWNWHQGIAITLHWEKTNEEVQWRIVDWCWNEYCFSHARKTEINKKLAAAKLRLEVEYQSANFPWIEINLSSHLCIQSRGWDVRF